MQGNFLIETLWRDNILIVVRYENVSKLSNVIKAIFVVNPSMHDLFYNEEMFHAPY